ncbi:MAG: endonuclease/exonuclease/phosphatase family protein [Muribaculaceae bacterium]|nr:endonuclease/exonuclease/phosphatase family protein [Muribaculaceae bacterium]
MKIPLLNPIFRMVMRIVSIIVFLLTIISAFGGRMNPEYLTIPSVLCLALPYFAILTGLLIIFWAVTKRVIFTVLGVLTLVVCAGPLSLAFPLSSKKHAEEGNTTFKIISWNVLHTDDIRKPEYGGNRAVEFMINSGADVICLAELLNFSPKELKKASPQLIDSLIRLYPFRAGLASTDIKVLSKYPVHHLGITDKKGGKQPRFDFFAVNFPGSRILNIGMVHLYSYDLSEEERNVMKDMKSVGGAKESVKELKGSILSKLRNAFRRRAENATELREVINSFRPSSPLIICGDFNDVPASWAYNKIKGEDMNDAYVETNFGPAITYNLHGFYFHIDQMLYRGNIKALSLKVDKINTSDHYPLVGEFEFTNPEK